MNRAHVRIGEQRLALGRRLDLGELAQACDRFLDVASARRQVGARLAAARQLVAELLGGLERRAAILGLDGAPVPLDRLVGVACIGPGEADGDLVRVLSIVEKPDPADAPSDLAVIGRYVLAPGIFDALRRTTPGAGGEIQLTDAIGLLAADEPVFALPFAAGRFDVGNPLDAMKAQVERARTHDEIGPAFRAWLHELLG